MIQKQRYGDAVDWWSFGCVLYEFLTGRCPFSKQNTKMERDEATVKWTLTFPKYIGNNDREAPWPAEATDIISKLLNRDPSKRLGARRNPSNIREHSFFGKSYSSETDFRLCCLYLFVFVCVCLLAQVLSI
jgi:serine/threonine protein kinase